VVDKTKSVDSGESEGTNSEELEEKKTFTEEEIKAVQLEAKTYRKEKADLKKERDEFEAKLKAIEAEKLTEAEKDKKKIAELEKQLADIQGSIKAKDIDNLILKSLSGKNIVDTDAAELLIKKELESVDEITPEAVTKIADKLIKDKPYLISSTPVNPSDGNFAKQDNEPAKTPDKMFGEFLRG